MDFSELVIFHQHFRLAENATEIKLCLGAKLSACTKPIYPLLHDVAAILRQPKL
jgi:hypothetical protein